LKAGTGSREVAKTPRGNLTPEERTQILGRLAALEDLIAMCESDSGEVTWMNDAGREFTEAENRAMWSALDGFRRQFEQEHAELEADFQARCGHEFQHTTACVHCGWFEAARQRRPTYITATSPEVMR
jgi:hypothetical protein